MRPYIRTAIVIICWTAFCHESEGRTLEKRQVAAAGAIDPHHHSPISDDMFRDKRKIEAKYGVKNAILGFVFNKINSFIDQKTHWIAQLDQTNIAKNKAHGIEPPKDPIVSLSAILSGAIGQKLHAAAPLITVVTNKLTSGSSHGGHTGFNIGALLGGGGLGGFGASAQAHVGAGGPTAYGA